jgi:hypothetical protein
MWITAPITQPALGLQEYRTKLAATPVWDRIWTADWSEIKDLELVPGYPLESDVVVIPRSWASGGAFQALGMRTIRFDKLLPEAWNRDESRSEFALRRIKRIAALIFLHTLRVGYQVRNPPKPSTWVRHCKLVARAARYALALDREANLGPPSVCADPMPIFQNLTPPQIKEISTAIPSLSTSIVPRLNALLAADAFDDWPATDIATDRTESESSQPFNDAFTAALGHAAVWIMEVLGPDLLSCWEALREIDATDEGHRRHSEVLTYRKQWLADWRGPTLTPELPFLYKFCVSAHNGEKRHTTVLTAWVPSAAVQVRALVFMLQCAHMVVLALSTAPRDGEMADLPRDCLRELRDQDLLVGQTYKLSDAASGEQRNWPLPKVAVQAIRQQQRLANIMQPGGLCLFVPFSAAAGDAIKVTTTAYKAFCDRVLLPDGRPLSELCEGTVHSHRFRKTAARLCALSLVGANQILFDVLGHRDPEMTLNYILSDPDLQDEIRQIAHEAAIILAEDAIKGAETNGGPAAAAVRELKARLTPRSAEKEMEMTALRLVAEILSQNGRVMLVRPNVLCTKTFNQFGPCTRRAGNPDIGDCQVDCVHRLELAAARADHRKAIEQVLEEIPSEGGMMRPWWQAQLLGHLMPFADLRAEMLGDPRVQAALIGVSQHSIGMLDEHYRKQVQDMMRTA